MCVCVCVRACVRACMHACVCICLVFSHRFSVSFSYYGLSLGADSLSDNLYVSCALMGLVELPGKLICTQAIDR